jgi:hypothetical protein
VGHSGLSRKVYGRRIILPKLESGRPSSMNVVCTDKSPNIPKEGENSVNGGESEGILEYDYFSTQLIINMIL